MDAQLEELKRLCAAATPGPWSRQDNYPVFVNSEAVRWPVVDDGIETGETYPSFIANTGDSTRNADFIAAANPATVSDLITRLEKALVDSARLDALDAMNQRKNKQIGTIYGWKLEENHNRIALSDSNIPALTVRQAIDAVIPAAIDAARVQGEKG